MTLDETSMVALWRNLHSHWLDCISGQQDDDSRAALIDMFGGVTYWHFMRGHSKGIARSRPRIDDEGEPCLTLEVAGVGGVWHRIGAIPATVLNLDPEALRAAVTRDWAASLADIGIVDPFKVDE